MRTLAAAVLSVVLAGCGADDVQVTAYLEGRVGPEGPPGQIAPLLEPVGRDPREGLGGAEQVLIQLRQGPTPGERARGLRSPISPATRLRLDRTGRGTAFVRVSGQPLDVRGVAAVVFSLTELAGIERVRVCCLRRHDGSRVFVHTQASFRGWPGEPCALRRENRCLRDR